MNFNLLTEDEYNSLVTHSEAERLKHRKKFIQAIGGEEELQKIRNKLHDSRTLTTDEILTEGGLKSDAKQFGFDPCNPPEWWVRRQELARNQRQNWEDSEYRVWPWNGRKRVSKNREWTLVWGSLENIEGNFLALIKTDQIEFVIKTDLRISNGWVAENGSFAFSNLTDEIYDLTFCASDGSTLACHSFHWKSFRFYGFERGGNGYLYSQSGSVICISLLSSATLLELALPNTLYPEAIEWQVDAPFVLLHCLEGSYQYNLSGTFPDKASWFETKAAITPPKQLYWFVRNIITGLRPDEKDWNAPLLQWLELSLTDANLGKHDLMEAENLKRLLA